MERDEKEKALFPPPNQLLNNHEKKKILSVRFKTFLSASVSQKKEKMFNFTKLFFFQICLEQCRSAL